MKRAMMSVLQWLSWKINGWIERLEPSIPSAWDEPGVEIRGINDLEVAMSIRPPGTPTGALTHDIKEHGLRRPLLVNGHLILDGALRREALMALGCKRVPVHDTSEGLPHSCPRCGSDDYRLDAGGFRCESCRYNLQ